MYKTLYLTRGRRQTDQRADPLTALSLSPLQLITSILNQLQVNLFFINHKLTRNGRWYLTLLFPYFQGFLGVRFYF